MQQLECSHLLLTTSASYLQLHRPTDKLFSLAYAALYQQFAIPMRDTGKKISIFVIVRWCSWNTV